MPPSAPSGQYASGPLGPDPNLGRAGYREEAVAGVEPPAPGGKGKSDRGTYTCRKHKYKLKFHIAYNIPPAQKFLFSAN